MATNRMLTPAEAAKSFLDIGRKAVAEARPDLKEDSPEYNRMLCAVLMGASSGLFYGEARQ